MARYLYERTRVPNLCLAGGVALNSVMNAHLLVNSPFKNIYVQPAADDAGTSLGSALYIYHHILGHPRHYVMDHAYLGPEYSASDIKHALEISKVPYEYRDDIVPLTARLIAGGGIVERPRRKCLRPDDDTI